MDGWRIVAYKDGSSVRLVSRRGRDHTHRFPDLPEAIARLPASTMILDGEVARFDDQLVSRFYLLSDAPEDAIATPPLFVAFDCLWVRGQDLRHQPLAERRQQLEREIRGHDLVLPVRRLDSDGFKAWDDIVQRGCEGLVAKDAASIYRSGRQSTSWLKVKVRRQGVFLIGGIIQAGPTFGGLLGGDWEGESFVYRATLEYGFTRSAVVRILTHCQPLVRQTCPFADLKPREDVIWLEPRLTAEVEYAELMQGWLREPVFRQLITG